VISRAIAVLVPLMVLAAACSSGHSGPVSGAGPTTTRPHPPHLTVALVVAPRTWRSGSLIVDPAPATTRPHISAAAAYRATVVNSTPAPGTPTVMFGLFTDQDYGKISPSGLDLTYDHYPAWLVWHRRAPDPLGSCTRVSPATRCTPTVGNSLSVVDPTTGRRVGTYFFG
jgi:hypothetical protein